MTRPLTVIVAEDEQERDLALVQLAQDAVGAELRLIVAGGDDRLDRLKLPGAVPWGFEDDRELLEPDFPPTQELAATLREHRAYLLAVVPPLRHPGEMRSLLPLYEAARGGALVVLRSELHLTGHHAVGDDVWATLPGAELRLSKWRKPGETHAEARARRAAERARAA